MEIAREILPLVFYGLLMLVAWALLTGAMLYFGDQMMRSKQAAGLTEFCRRIGGGQLILPPWRPFNPEPFINTTYRKHPLKIYMSHLKGSRGAITLEIMTGSSSSFRFEIARRSFLIRKIGGDDPEVKTGNPTFDSDFFFTSNQPEKASSVLSPSDLIQLAYHAKEQRFVSLGLLNGIIRYSSVCDDFSPRYSNGLKRMLDIAATIAERSAGKHLLPEKPWLSPVPHSTDGEKWPDDDEYLGRLVRDLFGGKWTSTPGADIYSLSYRSRIISLLYRNSDASPALEIVFPLIQKFWIRVLPQTGSDMESEVVTGDEELDGMFRIHCDHREVAVSFLQLPPVSNALKTLKKFNRFEIHRGKAKLTIVNPGARGFLRSHMEKTLEQMSIILDEYAQQQLLAIVHSSTGPTPLCPYCREKLDGEVVSCSACRTPHHFACWTENTQCTTWGCSSTLPQ